MDIIDYGVNTPQNFNPNVVRGMLNNSDDSGDGISHVTITQDETTKIVTIS